MTDEHQAPERTAEAHFADYFRRNYPGPDTIIHDPDWHAPKLFQAAQAAIRRATQPDDKDATIARLTAERDAQIDRKITAQEMLVAKHGDLLKAEAERDAALAAGFAQGIEAAADPDFLRPLIEDQSAGEWTDEIIDADVVTLSSAIRALAPQPEADPVREAALKALCETYNSFQDECWVGTPDGFNVEVVGFFRPYYDAKMKALDETITALTGGQS